MAMIHHMSDVKSDPEEGLFHHTLPWRDDNFKELMHRCDASLSLIRKCGPVYLLHQNHEATTNSNNFNLQGLDFFKARKMDFRPKL